MALTKSSNKSHVNVSKYLIFEDLRLIDQFADKQRRCRDKQILLWLNARNSLTVSDILLSIDLFWQHLFLVQKKKRNKNVYADNTHILLVSIRRSAYKNIKLIQLKNLTEVISSFLMERKADIELFQFYLIIRFGVWTKFHLKKLNGELGATV